MSSVAVKRPLGKTSLKDIVGRCCDMVRDDEGVFDDEHQVLKAC